MPWCPVCKNEYVKGYTRCSDCDVDLVESLEDGPVAIIFGEEGPVSQMTQFLQDNGISEAFSHYDEKEKAYELYVPKQNVQAAKNMINELLRQKAEEESEQEMEVEELEGEVVDPNAPKTPERRRAGSYEDKNIKAQEYRSSAFALIIVGAIGIVALVLFWMGVLPFKMYGMGKIVFTGVMGFLFLVFLVMGFNSIKMHKTYLAVASKENSLIDDVKAFMEEKFTKDQIDTTLHISPAAAEDDAAQAQLYFVRVEYIKRTLLECFPDMDFALADKLADDWYSKQYDE